MGKIEDLAKLDRAIKDGEIRLQTVKANLVGLEQEIDVLSTLETQLEENIKCLKKKNIIAIALEFRRAKEDLKKTKNRLAILKNDREHYRKAHSDVEKVLKKTREEFSKIEKGESSNVLRGNFGKKKNGQR